MTSQPGGRLSIGVKRRIVQLEQSEQLPPAKKMGEEPKRANFSALSPSVGPNGTKLGSLANKPSPSAGVKKIVIKSMKELPRLPDNYQEVAWKNLEEAVVAVQRSTSIPQALEDLYQAVENLCAHGYAPVVYSRLKNLTEAHVQSNLAPFLAESVDPGVFLRMLNDCWTAHCRQMILIRSIFLYLDRKYVLQNAGVASIWDMSLETFKVSIIGDPLVQSRTVEGLLLLIDKERQGDTVDRSLLKSLLRMLSDLAIYHDAFETKFLAATERVYSAEGQRLMQEREVPEYLAHVDKRLHEESQRLLHYLDNSTKFVFCFLSIEFWILLILNVFRRALISAVEKQLIGEHLTAILQKGLDALVEENRIADLKLTFNLLSRVKNGSDLIL